MIPVIIFYMEAMYDKYQKQYCDSPVIYPACFVLIINLVGLVNLSHSNSPFMSRLQGVDNQNVWKGQIPRTRVQVPGQSIQLKQITNF